MIQEANFGLLCTNELTLQYSSKHLKGPTLHLGYMAGETLNETSQEVKTKIKFLQILERARLNKD